MLGYYLGCIVLGITTGLLVGMSNSPVVQLPLLFALIGGSAGLFAIKASVTARAATAKLAVAGWTSVSLTLPFLVSMLYGSLVRTGADVSSLFPLWKNTAPEATLSIESVAGLPTDSAVTILLVNRALSKTSIAEADRKAVVKKMIADCLAAKRKFQDISGKIAHQAHAIVARLDAISASQNEIATDSAFTSAQLEFQSLDRTFSNSSTEPSARLEIARKAEDKLAGTSSSDFTLYLRTDRVLADQLDEGLTLIRSLPAADVLTGATKTYLFGLAAAAAPIAQSTNPQVPSVANNDWAEELQKLLEQGKDNPG